MPKYSLLGYRKNYLKTSGSLCNYYRDGLTDEANDNIGPNKNVINSKSFNYKTNITGTTYSLNNNGDSYANKKGTKEVEIAVPLKYLSNFWRTLDIELVNWDVPLTLS